MKFLVTTLIIVFLSSCSQSQETKGIADENNIAYSLQKTNEEWKAELTDEEYHVLIEKGTERAFTGDLLDNKKTGTYVCRACNKPLFSSTSKFNSGTGWPSFDQAINQTAIREITDDSHGMTRAEVTCNHCGGHLGHVFNDGPTSTGLRYCVNSCSLDFESGERKVQHEWSTDTLTLGGGCFWCVEAIYEILEGVIEVESGYSGGDKANATYNKVSSGITNHAEVVQVIFDTKKVSLYDVLEVFFSSHDPTTLNRQGADAGPQYRSIIFYRNAEQKMVSQSIITELTKNKIYDSPIVTKVDKFKEFYSAEEYHQDYYRDNTDRYYCKAVITPKVEKFKQIFKDKLKK